jgi:hypothetical protein
MSEFLRAVHGREAVKAVVGNLGDSNVSFARIGARGRKVRLRKDTKQRCFADLRQTNDASFHKRSRQPSAVSHQPQPKAKQEE